MSELSERFETHEPGEKQVGEKIRCDACPVMCYIAEGRTGACDRYGNLGGRIVRCDPLTHPRPCGGERRRRRAVRRRGDWDGELVNTGRRFVTAIGAGTTYPDYKPAPFIVSQEVEGVDLVTVVTEGIFSYCGVKVKIDTDRHLGPETAVVRAEGEAVGHVTTGEYGSQMLSLGGVHHLTGGSKSEGRVTCDTLLKLCNRKPVELAIDGGATVIVEAGKPPVIDGKLEQPHARRLRLGHHRHVRRAMARAGRRGGGRRRPHHRRRFRAPGRQGAGLGGYRHQDPRPALDAGALLQGLRAGPRLGRHDDFRSARRSSASGTPKKGARPGLSLLMVSTTGEQFAYYELDDELKPVEKPFPDRLAKSVGLIEENCEPALCTVLFVGGAGGIAARRRHRKPGQPDPLGAGPADLCHRRRRAGLCLAGRRHHPDGRRDPRAGQRLRLCADAGAGGADRIHAAPRRTIWRSAAMRRRSAPSTTSLARGGEYLNAAPTGPAGTDNPWPPLAQLRRARQATPR